MRKLQYPLLLLVIAQTFCSCQRLTVERNESAAVLNGRTVAALNRLRDETNAQYGYRQGVPRVNLGPCGRFAKIFREQWNARFPEKTNIALVMSGDGSFCHHVLVKLPSGSYFDGGNGVISEDQLLKIYPGSRIEVMLNFDMKVLDQRSYGLKREYPICPNYSDELTSRMIVNCLSSLSNDWR